MIQARYQTLVFVLLARTAAQLYSSFCSETGRWLQDALILVTFRNFARREIEFCTNLHVAARVKPEAESSSQCRALSILQQHCPYSERYSHAGIADVPNLASDCKTTVRSSLQFTTKNTSFKCNSSAHNNTQILDRPV